MIPKPTFIHTQRDYKDNRLIIYHKVIYDVGMETGKVYLLRFDCKCEEPMEIGIDMVGYSLGKKDEYKVATSVFVYPEIVNYKLLVEVPKWSGSGGEGVRDGRSESDDGSGRCNEMTKLVMFSNKLFVVENLGVENSKERKPLVRTIGNVGSELDKIGYGLRKVFLNEKDIDIFDNEHYEIYTIMKTLEVC